MNTERQEPRLPERPRRERRAEQHDNDPPPPAFLRQNNDGNGKPLDEAQPSLPPAPRLSMSELGNTVRESREQVLARYGKPERQVPSIMLATTEATRMSGKKLCDDAHSSIIAAEKILDMLKHEFEEYRSEVERHTNNFAARVEAYFGTCLSAIDAMSKSREEMLKVSQVISDNPVVPLAPKDDPPGAA